MAFQTMNGARGFTKCSKYQEAVVCMPFLIYLIYVISADLCFQLQAPVKQRLYQMCLDFIRHVLGKFVQEEDLLNSKSKLVSNKKLKKIGTLDS